MKKTGYTLIGIALGTVLGVSLIPRAQAQDGQITLYGDAPKGAKTGGTWTFAFKDPEIGKLVAQRQGQVKIENGRYMAKVDRKDLAPAALYSVNVTGENGEELAMVTFVTLQATTPGVAETGNINVTGTILATTKIGVGTGSMPYMLNARTATSTGGAFAQSGGNGVRGVSTAVEGSFAGGSFNGSSNQGYGVFGVNSATSGTAYGGYFKTNSPMGTALYGDTLNNTHVEGFIPKFGVKGTARIKDEAVDNSAGVYGEAILDAGLFGYGVLGSITQIKGDGDSIGYGVFSIGDSGASGTKTFLIDDPRNPEGAWLRHYSSEGAEPLLIYSGTATLDNAGKATVSLPGYWASVNTNPRYQLTPIGAAMPNLHVASKVQGNTFAVAGGKPGAEVTWTIIGTRNDPWVRRAGVHAEVPKPASARGKYFDPSLYGQPTSKSIVPSDRGTVRIDPQ